MMKNFLLHSTNCSITFLYLPYADQRIGKCKSNGMAFCGFTFYRNIPANQK